MIAQRIIDRMRDKNIKLTQAANDLGLSDGFFYDLKNGRKKTVGSATLSAVADLLDCDVEYLLGSQEAARREDTRLCSAQSAKITGAVNHFAWIDPTNDPWAGRTVASEPDARFPKRDQALYVAVAGDPSFEIADGSLVWSVGLNERGRVGDVLIVEERKGEMIQRSFARVSAADPDLLVGSQGNQMNARDPNLTIAGRVTRVIRVL